MGESLDAQGWGLQYVTFPEANFGPALARYWAKGAGSRLAMAGPALYPYIHTVNFSRK
jgi:hypothetical protein